VSGAAVDDVAAFPGGDDVVAAASGDRVVVGRPEELVRLVGANQQVVKGEPATRWTPISVSLPSPVAIPDVRLTFTGPGDSLT
jgi:hypothetical protein